MPEELSHKEFVDSQFYEDEYYDLLYRAKQGIDGISAEEREKLISYGWYYLTFDKNEYNARSAFEALNDFQEVRKFADYLLGNSSESFELICALIFLEDYDCLRKLLNNANDNFLEYVCEYAFFHLTDPLLHYVKQFLTENRTPVATGGINTGIDLIAIRNLAQEYDIAVPIARGGLYQGAIAHL